MRVFSSEPLNSLKNRLKKSFFNGRLEDLDYQENWMLDQDGASPSDTGDHIRKPDQ